MAFVDDPEEFNALVAKAVEFLTDLGVKADIIGPFGFSDKTVCAVNRTSMVNVVGGAREHAAYDETMNLLQEFFGEGYYLMWSGRNDEYMTVDFATR